MINTYRLEIDNNNHPVLVKENEESYVVEPLTNPAKVVELCDELMRLRYLAEENVIMIAVDVRGGILGIFKVSQGTVCYAICNSREIYMRALMVGASAVFIIHNHPSGDCTPSKDDIESAIALEKAGKLIGIKLTDFIIIGKNSFYSARESKLLENK